LNASLHFYAIKFLRLPAHHFPPEFDWFFCNKNVFLTFDI
jgi:hypothetical protein